MTNLKEVRHRIQSVSSIKQITTAMKMVSTSKLLKANSSIVRLRPYADKFKEIMSRVATSLHDNSSTFSAERIPTKVLVVTVTTTKGLVGGFNSAIIKATNNLIRNKYAEQFENGEVRVLTIGRKGYNYYNTNHYRIIDNYVNLFDDLCYDKVLDMTNNILTEYKIGNFNRVDMVYNQFLNPSVQILTVERLLPFLYLPEIEKDIKPNDSEYIIEPSETEIVENLIPKAITLQIYKAFLESNASEHGARMTAMDNASENADVLIKELRIKYNQARQNSITNEILEIVSGAEALTRR
ncbi:ATP synthase F1 subunit gamma [Olivibacter jilunii]|uniref:ATP synthase F1 subunit gamma n=1 Tax=Olivibacter jilunii TaxID=985016 RepID=UPI00103275EE|nr:ATP synthase F1 subunit gamma [Olivibacter jilunii]